MRIFRVTNALISVAAWAVLGVGLLAMPARAQTAAEAALNMANMLDGAGGGVSNSDLMAALEGAAEAGQPMALYRLGTMYENGEGVQKDPVKAFGYFSQIANDHADAAPKGVEADIVAQSFVKVGEYYREGLPDAGIKADADRSHALLMHAASYFGDADAQFRVGQLYLKDDELGVNPLQSARWMQLAARKGHAAAQAMLGDMLFNGEGIDKQPVEGLMWLTVAHKRTMGTSDEGWVNEMLTNAMSIATPNERAQAIKLADSLGARFGGQQ
jgi:TPR repeat protein